MLVWLNKGLAAEIEAERLENKRNGRHANA